MDCEITPKHGKQVKERMHVFLICVVLLIGVGSSALGEDTQLWQLVFSYDQDSLTLLDASRIPAMRKKVATSALGTVPLKVEFQLKWLSKDKNEILSTNFIMPVGVRYLPPNEYACHTYIPDKGTIMVRVEGPPEGISTKSIQMKKGKVSGRLSEGSPVPSAFRDWEFTLPDERATQKGLLAPVGVEKIRDTGPDGNRCVMVFMGDGYTAENLALGDFAEDSATMELAFLGKPPWDTYLAATNIYRIDVESNEEGTDNPHLDPPITVDTYFNTGFGNYGLLTPDITGLSRLIAAADSQVGTGVWDIIVLLVNTTEYGGAGQTSGGQIAITSVHHEASEIVLHEMGHSFAGLADEYESGPSRPLVDPEPNVDLDFARGSLKWQLWVESGTPLPTPETEEYLDIVGAFEGARYHESGIYRPWLRCLMRGLNLQFCPVCKEAHALEFTNRIEFSDDELPASGSVVELAPGGIDISITPIPLSPLEYRWTLGGIQLEETGPVLHLTSEDLFDEEQTLEVYVTHPTDLIRKTTVAKSYQWTLVKGTSSVADDSWAAFE